MRRNKGATRGEKGEKETKSGNKMRWKDQRREEYKKTKKKEKVVKRAYLTSGSQSQWVSLQRFPGSWLFQSFN